MRVFLFIIFLISTQVNAQDVAANAVENENTGCFQIIRGLVKDQVTKELLPNTIVSIQDDEGNPIDSQMIKKDGQFTFRVNCDGKYRLKAIKKSYTLQTKNFTTTNTSGLKLKTEIYLDKGSISFISKSKSVTSRKAMAKSKAETKVTTTDIKSSIAKADAVAEVNVAKQKEVKSENTVVASETVVTKADLPDTKISAEPTIVKPKVKQEVTVADVDTSETLNKEQAQVAIAETAVEAKETIKTTKNSEQKDVLVLEPIIFDYESSYLNKQAKQELRKVVSILKKNPEVVLECASYTDAKGSEKYNQWMSDRRAKRTVDYIISRGISPSRISGKGYGEAKLLIPCEDDCTDQQRAVNRRTEFIVVNK